MASPETPEGRPLTGQFDTERGPDDTHGEAAAPLPSPEELALADALDAYWDALTTGGSDHSQSDGDLVGLRAVTDRLHELSEYLGVPAADAATDVTAADALTVASGAEPAVDDGYAPTVSFAAGPDGPSVTDRIGKYQIVQPLHRGGQACTYVAFDPDLHRQVVIKWYHAAASPEDRELVLNEGRALARVRSPYVAQCYGADRHEGAPYLVLEYIRGEDLARRQKRRKLQPREAVQLVAKLAEGLEGVHACGLIHRDVKPANILIGDDGEPRLVDFGLAESIAAPNLNRFAGTLAYMAPEQARCDLERIDARSDVFGLGAVLYELLTGRPPHAADGPTQLFEAACAGDVVPAAERVPDLDAGLNAICMRCLAADPQQRYASAGELRQAALGWLDVTLEVHLPDEAPQQVEVDVPGQGRMKLTLSNLGGKLTLVLSTAVALLLLAPLAWHGLQNDAPQVARLAPVPREDVAPKSGGTSDAPPSVAAASDDGTDHLEVRPAENVPPLLRLAPARPLQKIAFGAAGVEPRGGGEAKLREDFEFNVAFRGIEPDDQGTIELQAGDHIQLEVTCQRDAYVGLWSVDGITGTITQLFPNEREPDHFCKAGAPRRIPGNNAYHIEATPADAPALLYALAATRSWESAPGRRVGPYLLYRTEQEQIRLRENIDRGLEIKPNEPAAKVAEAVLRYAVQPAP